MTTSWSSDVPLLVCQTCRCSHKTEDTGLISAQLPQKPRNTTLRDGVTVKRMFCPSNFRKILAIALKARFRWFRIYRNINPKSDFEQLCAGISSYCENDNGNLLWKQQVALVRGNSIACILLKNDPD
tara:strand:+ start:132 stop:512 length:381 start_codon:yes stop_codon:yes gene_type:complete